MEVLQIGNITIQYNNDDWNSKKSIKKTWLKFKIVGIVLALSIVVFTITINILTTYIGYVASAIIGSLVMCIALFSVEHFIEYKIYEKENVAFRALDYFSRLKSESVSAEIVSHKVVLRDKRNDVWLNNKMKELRCVYRISYEDRYSIKDNTPIKLVMDTTRKSIAELYVTVNNDKVENNNDST